MEHPEDIDLNDRDFSGNIGNITNGTASFLNTNGEETMASNIMVQDQRDYVQSHRE